VFLEKIYLLKAFTGMGYGEQVLLALHAQARNEGSRSIYLATMKKGRALSFYKKLGYQVLKEEILPFENAVPKERGMFLLGRSLE
jgi:GNAT superfamily N-acetyltransferase